MKYKRKTTKIDPQSSCESKNALIVTEGEYELIKKRLPQEEFALRRDIEKRPEEFVNCAIYTRTDSGIVTTMISEKQLKTLKETEFYKIWDEWTKELDIPRLYIVFDKENSPVAFIGAYIRTDNKIDYLCGIIASHPHYSQELLDQVIERYKSYIKMNWLKECWA